MYLLCYDAVVKYSRLNIEISFCLFRTVIQRDGDLSWTMLALKLWLSSKRSRAFLKKPVNEQMVSNSLLLLT